MFAAGCEGWAVPGVIGETRVARFCSQISPPDGMPCSGNPQGRADRRVGPPRDVPGPAAKSEAARCNALTAAVI